MPALPKYAEGGSNGAANVQAEERQMAFAMASLDELEIGPDGLVHKPTGCRFWLYPSLEEIAGTWSEGALMPNGAPYSREDVRDTAREYLRLKNESPQQPWRRPT